MRKKIKRYAIFFWIILLIIFGIFLLTHRELTDPRELARWVEGFGVWSLGVYALIFLFRGLLLVPSTPLILVGMLLFPSTPHTVFVISMLGIIFSSYVIYRFSDILGLDDYFASHVKSEKIKKMIEKYGFYAVAFWSFFLVLPTDLICYIAGAVRMNVYKFLTAVALGEGLIIAIFIYTGRDVLSYLLDFFR